MDLAPVFPCQVLPLDDGKFIISDTGNSRLIIRDSTQIIYNVGLVRSGDNLFSNICDITHDRLGNMYVTDSQNHRVIKYDKSGNVIS